MIRPLFAILVSLFLFSASLNSAEASDMHGKEVHLSYSVIATSLVEAMNIDVSLSVTDDGYVFDSNIKTKGFLGAVLPWGGQLYTKGHLKNDRFIPKEHSFSNYWADDNRTTLFQFNRAGRLTNMKVTSTEDDPHYKVFPEEMTYGALDILTAATNLFVMADTYGKCAGIQTVFDGKRRFDLVFHDKGEATLSNKRHGIYTGPTLTCDVEVVPLAGKWHGNKRGWIALQEQSRTNGHLPKLWLAKIDKDIPHIPARLQVRTNFGPLTMILTDYRRETIEDGDIDSQ